MPPPRTPLVQGLIFALAALSAAADGTSPAASTATGVERLGDGVLPVFQAIELTVDPRREDYDGSVRIELDVRRPADRFRLHSESGELRRVALSGARGEVAVEHAAQGEDLLAVRPVSGTLPAGRYTLEIDFSSRFGTTLAGLYRVEKDGESYAFTVFQPADARQAFPCWDEPAFKIPFQVTVRVPEGQLAISNTPEQQTSVDDGWRTVTFRQTPPLPSYGVALSVGPFETVAIPGLRVPGRIVTARGQSRLAAAAAALTPPILDALERYFGLPYPFEKLDLLAVPGFPSGGLENPAAVIFSEDMLLVDPGSTTAARRRSQALLVAHELAHMWFGNLVTLSWWDDIWLNEAFATWMGNRIAAQTFPELRAEVEGLRRAQRAMELDAAATATPIRRQVDDPREAFTVGGALTYYKGSQVLAMFESWLGAERFQRGVRAYMKAHAWGNATAADLWRALDESSGEPVSQAIATFLDQPGVPLIDVALDEGRLEIRQQRFAADGQTAGGSRWKIPVTVKLGHPDGTRTETYLLAREEQSIALKDADGQPWQPLWVFPNAAAAGYYRWNLSAELLQALTANATERLAPRERLDLISNAGALLEAGKIGGDRLLEVLGALAGDPDPAVIGALCKALDTVKATFVTADLEPAFATFVRRTLSPALEHFGREPAAGEAEAVALVRGELFLRLGRDGGGAELRRQAREQARTYLDGGKLSPELVRPALQLAAVDGDRQLLDAYRQKLRAASNPGERAHLAAALGSFTRPELRTAALDEILAGGLGINELMLLATTLLAADEAGGDQVFAWVETHFEVLTARLPPMFVPFMPLFADGCSLDRLDKARDFFSQPQRQAPGMESQLTQVAGQVEDCARLRRREGEAVRRYLLQMH